LRKILNNITLLKLLRKLVSHGLNVNVDTFSGESHKILYFAGMKSKLFIYFRCLGKYTFIGEGVGIGRKGQKITYQKAW
jgi:hypothetical protein